MSEATAAGNETMRKSFEVMAFSSQQGVEEHKAMVSSVAHAINDEGKVKDSASDNVSKTRAKVHTIQGRLRSVLKGMKGEISEQVRGGRQPWSGTFESAWDLADHKCHCSLKQKKLCAFSPSLQDGEGLAESSVYVLAIQINPGSANRHQCSCH